jgi:hypothetical protein
MQTNACRTISRDAYAVSAYVRPKFTVIEGGLRRRESRRSDVVAVAAMALVAFAVFAGAWLATNRVAEARVQSAFEATSYETVTVTSGDSLWSIAESHPVEGCSTQEVVRHIREENALESASLSVGTRLTVPTMGN